MPTNENLEPSDEEAQRTLQDFLGFIADVSAEVHTFDYTDEQWADIERSLHLQPDQAALETRATSWSRLPESIWPSN